MRSIFAWGTINMMGGAGWMAQSERGWGRGWQKYSLFRGDTTCACSCASAGQRREFWRVDAPLCVASAAAFALFSSFSISLFLSLAPSPSLSLVHLISPSSFLCILPRFNVFRSVFPPAHLSIAGSRGMIRGDRIIFAVNRPDVNTRGISGEEG